MESPIHFKGKDAARHVAEAEAAGMISAAELHGLETPGHISAGADAARDTALLFLLFIPFTANDPLFLKALPFLLGLLAWKIGRASWLGWARLERLHRVLEQEKWEIEHNRPQERAELRELYRAKGFDGKLLEDVLDVLMADGDRLLKVMVEEELGLSLANVEHPLKQGLGAGIGTCIAGAFLLLGLYFTSPLLIFLTALIIIATSAALLASYARNQIIPAVVWNVALALFAFGLTHYTLKMLQ